LLRGNLQLAAAISMQGAPNQGLQRELQPMSARGVSNRIMASLQTGVCAMMLETTPIQNLIAISCRKHQGGKSS
jgi:hypothetical protein